MHWEHIKYTDPNISEIEWLPGWSDSRSVVFDYTTSRLNNNYCFYMNPYLEHDPQQNMTIAFHDLIYKATMIEDKFFPEKPTVRNRLIFHSFVFISQRLVTPELLYNGICDRVGRDLHPNDIIYIHYTGECFMNSGTYKIIKPFLKLCGETKVVFMSPSVNGVITSRTTKKLFSDDPNFYLMCSNDWMNATLDISTCYNKDFIYQSQYPKSKTFFALMGGLRPHRATTLAKFAVDGLLEHGYASWNVPEFGYNQPDEVLRIRRHIIEFNHPEHEILSEKFNAMNLPSQKRIAPLATQPDGRQYPPLDPFNIRKEEFDYINDAYVYFLPETQYFSSNQDFFDECVKLYDDQGNIYKNHIHVYSVPANFYSEKTWKPMAYRMPFIMAASPYNLQSLRGLGFKTFHPWIDETYDTIEDDYMRLDAICKELQRLTDNPPNKEWMNAVNEICEHNFKLLCEYNGDGPVTLLDNTGEIIKTDRY